MTSHLHQNGFPSAQRKWKRRCYHCCSRHRCYIIRPKLSKISVGKRLAIVLQKRRSRLWVIGSYEMPRCDWLQHCNFLAGIEILPFALQTACKPCGFAAGRPAIVAGPVLQVAIGESCSVCRALYWQSIQHVCSLAELKQVKHWEKCPDELCTVLLHNPATRKPGDILQWVACRKSQWCRHKILIHHWCQQYAICDNVTYTDGSVTRTWVHCLAEQEDNTNTSWRQCQQSQCLSSDHEARGSQVCSTVAQFPE